jgi:jumonji domain-containing protein 7
MLREFAPLASDVDSHISWASEALDSLPDATNVWIGNERSVSALHKDNYENIYCQITGHKKFPLSLPPPPLVIGLTSDEIHFDIAF